MLSDYLVGLDVGTTGAKAVVCLPNGKMVGQSRAQLRWRTTSAGAEASAADIARVGVAAIHEALASSPDGAVVGIGIASFAESGVLLDREGEPVGPVIAWHDRRDGEQLARLRAEFGADAFSAATGLPLSQQWSITKQRWITENVPGSRRAVLRLNIAEWIAYRLGARPVSEASLASRTGWLRLRDRTWWPEALEWAGIPRDHLPPLASAGEPVGAVSAHLRLQGAAGAAITIAGHDHQSAAVGLGGMRPGDEVNSCGTADALLRAIPPIPDDATVLRLAEAGVTVGWHAAPGLWNLLGASEGGLVLRRALAMLEYGDFTQNGLDDAAAALGSNPIQAAVDSNGHLTFRGTVRDASPEQVWAAAVDAAVAQSAALHDRISDLVGPPRRLLLTGGWLNSKAFARSKDRSLGGYVIRGAEEAGARGAAAFAAVAAGIHKSADRFGLAFREGPDA